MLFSSVDGNRSAHNYWLSEEKRNFDVVLYVYSGKILDDRVDFTKYRKGFKFENFNDFSKRCDVFNYEAVWIVDDDIQMAAPDINRMFDMFSRYGLQIGQPAFQVGSQTPMSLCIVDDSYHLRYSNFCENGVVIFSADALKKCLPIMRDIKTGWGVEYLFYKLIGEPDTGVGILDDVTCHHPDTKSALDLLVQRSFHFSEVHNLMDKYNYRIYSPKVLGGIKKNSMWSRILEFLKK